MINQKNRDGAGTLRTFLLKTGTESLFVGVVCMVIAMLLLACAAVVRAFVPEAIILALLVGAVVLMGLGVFLLWPAAGFSLKIR